MKESLNVFISGQKYFGCEILRLCRNLGHNVVGVSAPLRDGRPDSFYELAMKFEIPFIVPGGNLRSESIPENIDLGIAAHSFDFISKRARYKTRLGWIGYHPSLLPRHRGRDSIRWAIKMGDAITGGTVYWLNSGVDQGDIICQDWCFIDKNDSAQALWKDKLLPMGVKLIHKSLDEISQGIFTHNPQNEQFATWEPKIEAPPLYRPDLLMLEVKN